jgi:thiosulfate/3-mercaptopyruvate sulfurtransferase
MTSSPFISVSELADALSGAGSDARSGAGSDARSGASASSQSPIVLDASFVLHPPAFDGDYRTDNGRSRWLESHIPGSRHVDVATEFSDVAAPRHYTHPEPQAIADELARIGVYRDARVVVYDSTGTMFASRLWYLLRWIGVDVRVLDGGLAAWVAAEEPTVSGETAVPAPVESWEATIARRAWVSRTELVERAEDDDRALVCGLPKAQFEGSDVTRYSRRGHIPGSVNVSSRDLFSSAGTVKSRVELILAYDAAGVDVAAGSKEILLYCGGGISASANALTLAAIGVYDVRIYDGSLEEWSADPALPLVTVG